MLQYTTTIEEEILDTEIGRLEVSGTGKINIVNTGGSSSSEGGMGSGNSDDKAKGDLSGDKSGNTTNNDDDTSWDPIGKSIKEAEKENTKE